MTSPFTAEYNRLGYAQCAEDIPFIDDAGTGVEIDYFGGPAGNYGFRRGMWKATYRRETYRFFASIPHKASESAQISQLRAAAARHITECRATGTH